MDIIHCNDNLKLYTRELIGGKGYNLLPLYTKAQQSTISSELYTVPAFFIIPNEFLSYDISYDPNQIGDYRTIEFTNKKQLDQLIEPFKTLQKPIAVRSSSPLEDNLEATFAGRFHTELNVTTFEQLIAAAKQVINSQYNDTVRDYAAQKEIAWKEGMAIILQQQIIDAAIQGTIQIEEEEIIIEYYETNDSNKKIKQEIIEYDLAKIILDNIIHHNSDFKGEIDTFYKKYNEIISEHFSYIAIAALQAKKDCNLKETTQIEFLYKPLEKVNFVQIRELPVIKQPSNYEVLNLTIPEGIPSIESEICNGIAGEMILPAYVTFTPAKANTIANQFNLKNKIFLNHDLHEMKMAKKQGYEIRDIFPLSERLWEIGNKLFPEYILVCNKLDDSIIGMNTITKNKKAIITTMEANKTSHAITVARELGIIAFGANLETSDWQQFIYQIQTGDLIHIKSNGEKAIAYLEKRRESDPYQKD